MIGGSETGWWIELCLRGPDIDATLRAFEEMAVVYLGGITTLVSGNPRRDCIATGLCLRSVSRLSSAFIVVLTMLFRSD